MLYYKSLREYLEALDKAGKLVTINSPINKDTQLVPFTKLQDRGLPKAQQKAFLFTNVFDSRGIKYDIPVAYDILNGFYGIGLKCRPEEVPEKVAQALLHPIDPKLVEQGAVQEVVYKGDELLKKGGMDEFPVPNTHPGYDAGPIMSSSMWVTKDPDTGIRNVGLYRSQVFAQNRLGIHMAGPGRHITQHWQKCREKGIPLEVAIVVGGPPNLIYVGNLSVPYGVDEYTVAGAMAGEPVELVKCKTVDLEVPANADFVFEGTLTTEELEMEGPHGEIGELESMGDMQPYLTLKCITHRKDPIWMGPGSGPPGAIYKRLRYDLDMPHVLAAGLVPSSAPGGGAVMAIKMKFNADQKEVWRTLEVFSETTGSQSERTAGKYIIAVDEDIDIRDPDMVWWALGTRVEPHRDFRIVKYRAKDLKPSSFMPEPEMAKIRHRQFDPHVQLPEGSRLLVNATLKWPYPPVSLPKQEFMEEALSIWQKEGLPALKLREPWHGYELGFWPKEFAEDADRAVRGEYYKTSEMRFKKRVKVD